jgi:hypothetical protein
MSETDDRIDLSVEDAIAALDVQHQHYANGPEKWERDTVHCFLPTYTDGGLVLIGADWDLSAVRALFETDPNGPEVSGPQALAMHHGVGVRGRGSESQRFFATRKDWVPPTESTRKREAPP